MLDVWTGRSRRGGQCRSPRAADNGPDGAYSNYLALTALGGGADVQRACRSGGIVVLAMSPRHDGRKERSCWPTAGVGEPISSTTLHVMRRTEVHDDNPRIRQLLWQGFGQAQAVLVLQDHSEKDHLYIVVRSESPASPSLLTGFEESAGSSTPACFIRSAGTERAGPTTCTAWPRFHRRSPTCRSSRCRGSTVPSSSRECFRSRAGSHFPPGCDPLRRT